jgi:CRP-like cAMP-binding protein
MNATNNRLLAALPARERRAFVDRLELVSYTIKQSLYKADEPIPYVYFPLGGVFSIVSDADSGGIIEIATVGREGFVGVPVLLGVDRTPGDAFCQIAGDALRLRTGRFREELHRRPALRGILLRYTQSFINQISQNAACNRLHSIEQRCARWLLMTHDRVRVDRYLLTQEFLAQMLGVRRAGVSVVATRFQKEGFIRYGRGQLTIVNRRGLENAACACYGIMRREFDRPLR